LSNSLEIKLDLRIELVSSDHVPMI